ncbi:MAG: hypothetical protein NT175_00885 [Bacteroidetes bacterium]|nr:hypothetical protein [Bacteroidota bacterium]
MGKGAIYEAFRRHRIELYPSVVRTPSTPIIYLALPVQDELEYIPVFIECLRKQTVADYELFVCVNQPDDWWDKPSKVAVCQNNQLTLELLSRQHDLPITIIDRCSKGKGWQGRHFGVGWARKTAMDVLNNKAEKNDIIVSIDADTTFSQNYLETIRENFIQNPWAVALSVPYYHNLTGDEITDRCILRYEIYMRYYALNMWRIMNPYRFTAIGSAMAVPVWAYRAIGGITPHKSGEDFYFLQKLRKHGEILHWNNERIYPDARFSDRVFFGTGPAMIRGREGDWSSYPVYDYRLFDEVEATFDMFPSLFEKDIDTPMTDFLQVVFKTNALWKPLRENYKTCGQFVKACNNKVDALRILQYLKAKQKDMQQCDEENLKAFIRKFYSHEHLMSWKINPDSIDFDQMGLTALNTLRDFLASHEDHCRQSGYYSIA